MSIGPLLIVGAVGLMACKSSSSPNAPSASSVPGPTTAGRFEVTLPGSGVTQGGVLFRPEIAGAPHPAVIVLHGWQTAGANGALVVEGRARRYSEDGYVALALSMRGWPPTGGVDDCGLRQPDDVVAAVDWLRAQPGVDSARVGLIGFSQGGQVALLAGARGARVRAIAGYFPVTDVALWKATTANADIPGYISAVCEPGGTNPRSPRFHAAAMSAPVLLVHGDLDTRVPLEQSTLMRSALEAAGRPVELFVVPGAQHGFTAAEEAISRPVVDAFLAARLQ